MQQFTFVKAIESCGRWFDCHKFYIATWQTRSVVHTHSCLPALKLRPHGAV